MRLQKVSFAGAEDRSQTTTLRGVAGRKNKRVSSLQFMLAVYVSTIAVASFESQPVAADISQVFLHTVVDVLGCFA